MRTTERHPAQARRAGGPIRPVFDRLEPRLALSGADAGLPRDDSSALAASRLTGAAIVAGLPPIAGVEPAPGSVAAGSPASLSVAFDRGIDPFSIGAVDFALGHVADDGTASPLAPSEGRLEEAADPADPSGSRIVLTPSRPLAAGRYRLVLLGSSQLQTTDGLPLVAGGADREVTTFTVRKPGGGLADAVDLGLATPEVGSRPDRLDLGGDGQAVKLYKLELPAGHHWRLGLEVTTEGDGPALDSALALFDAQGRRIAVASQGRPGAPEDPYLFAGVAPGTYYVGVSGEGNVPGMPGGYDPARGIAGGGGRSQPGGRFLLSFVADPADRPTQVLGVRVDVPDPASKTPTGLTVQFSGPIRVEGPLSGGGPALALVDSSGRSWSATAAGYDGSLGQLSVVFDRPLPPGEYTVEAAPGGLVDLAGLVPAAEGLPPGVLGTIAVAPSEAGPEDLGPLLPGIASEGIASPLGVAAGGSAVRRFRVLFEGLYTILASGESAGLGVSLAGDRGGVPGFRPAADPADPTEIYLFPGAYTLTFANPGGPDFLGTVTVRSKFTSFSSLLKGGVGQGPALGLRLVTPSASIGRGNPAEAATSPPAPASGTAPASSVANHPASGINPRPFAGVSSPDVASGPSGIAPRREPGTGPGPSGSAAPSLSSGATSLAVAGPIGRPSPAGTPIGVVGPSGPGGGVAIASHQEGLPSGLAAIPAALPVGSRRGPTASPPRAPESRGEVGPTGPGAEIDFGLIAQRRASGPDDEILAEADWVDRIAVLALSRIEFLARKVASAGPELVVESEAAAATATPPALAAGEDRPGPTRAPSVELAAIAPQVGFGVLVMLAYRYRNRLQAGCPRSRSTSALASRRPILTGPHRKSWAAR